MLKSNKNEPAVSLESANSVRTALSDLYLEQLLQNKPKSDKVWSRVFEPLFIYVFTVDVLGVHVCFREAEMGHMTVVCSSTTSLKIDPY